MAHRLKTVPPSCIMVFNLELWLLTRRPATALPTWFNRQTDEFFPRSPLRNKPPFCHPICEPSSRMNLLWRWQFEYGDVVNSSHFNNSGNRLLVIVLVFLICEIDFMLLFILLGWRSSTEFLFVPCLLLATARILYNRRSGCTKTWFWFGKGGSWIQLKRQRRKWEKGRVSRLLWARYLGRFFVSSSPTLALSFRALSLENKTRCIAWHGFNPVRYNKKRNKAKLLKVHS